MQMQHDLTSQQTGGFWALNIKIPDDNVVEELERYFYAELKKSLQTQNISEEHRKFLQQNLHLAKSRDEVIRIFKEAKEQDRSHCLVIALNCPLPQKIYASLNVISLSYVSWTKEAWNKLKKAKENKIIQEIIEQLKKCLLKNIINLLCFAIKNWLVIPF